jgi:hypothetical protein
MHRADGLTAAQMISPIVDVEVGAAPATPRSTSTTKPSLAALTDHMQHHKFHQPHFAARHLPYPLASNDMDGSLMLSRPTG